jgi:hypothetical protein
MESRTVIGTQSFAPITAEWKTDQIHIVFDDGMVADILSPSQLVMGGVHNWLEVFAN